jgi:hypothetical protein
VDRSKDAIQTETLAVRDDKGIQVDKFRILACDLGGDQGDARSEDILTGMARKADRE